LSISILLTSHPLPLGDYGVDNAAAVRGLLETSSASANSSHKAGSAAKQLHRSRPWASYWLERFSKEGLDGLGDKPRSGRPSKLPVEVVMRIRRRLSESKEGWTTRQVQELIAKMGGGVTYHYTHVYRLLHRWGFKLKVPRRRHINTASKMEKMAFKKR
jgi:transposase